MLPLFDMMLQAQNGKAMEAMSKQFGLAQEQVTQGIAALMPAFATGFKRTASDPNDFGQLMSAMMSGNYSQYFEDLPKAFTPEGIADGNALLGQIFGSKDVSRAIAAQAAQISGIGQDVLKQMLPAMATAMMGGLMKQNMGQLPNIGDFWKNQSQANMIEQWMSTMGMHPKPKAPEATLFDNPFMQSFQAMMSGQSAGKTASNPFTANPFIEMFTSMMAKPAEKTGDAKEASTQKPAEDDGIKTLVNSMFDSGLEVQKNYQKNMDNIFDGYMNAMKPKQK